MPRAEGIGSMASAPVQERFFPALPVTGPQVDAHPDGAFLMIRERNDSEWPSGIPGIRPERVCPLSGRTLWTHPDWNVELPHYTNRLMLLGEGIVLAESRGFIHDEDTADYVVRFERMIAAIAPTGAKIHLLEDWTHLRGADNAARRRYVSYHLSNTRRLASLRFFGLNGLTRLLVTLGRTLHVVSLPVESHDDYASALRALGVDFDPSVLPPPMRKMWVPWLPSALLRPHGRRLADIFGSLPWGTRGEGRNPLSPSDPFHDLVAGWIAVKADLDQLQERASRQEAGFRLLMESVREGVWLCDSDGSTRWVNGSMANLLGTTVEALSGMDLSRLFPGGWFETAKERPCDPFEVQLPRSDGQTVWVLVSAGPMPTQSGEAAGVYAICTNISGRREAEARVRVLADDLEKRVNERTEELARSNRMLGDALQSREEFLAAMSHELRTPLATILNISESLRSGVQGALASPQKERLALLESNGHHLLALINDVLDLSKSVAGKLELDLQSVDLQLLCGESMQSIRPLAENHGIELVPDLGNVPVVARVDPLRVRQILSNLLSNGCKFSGEGSKVGLRLECDPVERMVHLVVWDQGPGIAPEARARLFTPFVQLDNRLSRQHGGTGLGLALSRKLAEQHGGRIGLESEVGKGCVFTVELPGYEPESEPPTSDGLIRASTAIPRSEVRERRVLLVEDNEDLRQTVAEYLDAAGWQVLAVSNGPAALEAFAQSPTDLVLMDIQMPGMDGLETIRRLRASPGGAFPKIIAISGLAFPEDVARSAEAGADLHLAKPVRLGQLAMLLDDLLRT